MQKAVSLFLLQKFKTANYIINDLKTRGFKILKFDYSYDDFWMRIHIDNYLNLISEDITQLFTDKFPEKIIELFNSFIKSDEFKYMEHLKNKIVKQKIIELIHKQFSPNIDIDEYSRKIFRFDYEDYQIDIRVSIGDTPNLCFTCKKYFPGYSIISDYLETFCLIYNHYDFEKMEYNHSVTFHFHESICNEKYLDELRK